MDAAKCGQEVQNRSQALLQVSDHLMDDLPDTVTVSMSEIVVHDEDPRGERVFRRPVIVSVFICWGDS